MSESVSESESEESEESESEGSAEEESEGEEEEEEEGVEEEPEQEEYIVEKIKSHKCVNGSYFYVVKWKGYDARCTIPGQEGRSLEAEANIVHCDALPRYWLSKGTTAGAKQYTRVNRLHQQALLDRRDVQ